MNAVACASNLTPNPFPSGKGNQIIESATGILFILRPFPHGKGPGVRFLGSFTTPAPHSGPPLQKGGGLGERFLSLTTHGAA
jgi:hypothetical protein